MVKTYDMENVSRGYDAKYEMVESVDHKGFADGLGRWMRVEDYNSLEARLDAVMLEYCPDEMTEEQRIRWAANQMTANDGGSEHGG